MNLGELYFITDSQLTTQGIIEDVKDALIAGVRVIQYREKHKSFDEMKDEALVIKRLCKENHAFFIVNDHLDLALEVEADGIHLGQSDAKLSEAKGNIGLIGISVGSLKQALKAEEHGADYLGVGPIFATDTKKDAGAPVGLETLKKINEKTNLPLVAIGGLNPENLKETIEAGADSLAMISAVVGKENMTRAINSIILAVKKAKGERK